MVGWAAGGNALRLNPASYALAWQNSPSIRFKKFRFPIIDFVFLQIKIYQNALTFMFFSVMFNFD